jgi:3-oxoacyl-[acyl-carrier protein] reductase
MSERRGCVVTGSSSGIGAAQVQGYRARAALAAVIAPEDVAEAAWWLGARALKTTGELLLVDAGVRIARG